MDHPSSSNLNQFELNQFKRVPVRTIKDGAGSKWLLVHKLKELSKKAEECKTLTDYIYGASLCYWGKKVAEKISFQVGMGVKKGQKQGRDEKTLQH